MLSSNGSNSHGLSLQPWPRHRGGSPWPWLEWRSLRSPCPPNLCGHISAMVTGLANPDLQTKWIKIYPTLLSSSIPTGNKKKLAKHSKTWKPSCILETFPQGPWSIAHAEQIAVLMPWGRCGAIGEAPMRAELFRSQLEISAPKDGGMVDQKMVKISGCALDFDNFWHTLPNVQSFEKPRTESTKVSTGHWSMEN
jgi:hypothetical protein